jgi:transposase InsO family protein
VIRAQDQVAGGISADTAAVPGHILPDRRARPPATGAGDRLRNGMVGRFNGWIEGVLQSHPFRSAADLATTLHRYVRLTNQQLPQSALGQHVALAGDEGLAQTQAAAVQKTAIRPSGM